MYCCFTKSSKKCQSKKKYNLTSLVPVPIYVYVPIPATVHVPGPANVPLKINIWFISNYCP